MTARIYRPAPSATQSGRAKSAGWVLVFEPSAARKIDPIMGYTSTTDATGPVKLRFATQAEAEAYAQRKGLDYWVQPAHEASIKRSTYTDNFRADRKVPWTH